MDKKKLIQYSLALFILANGSSAFASEQGFAKQFQNIKNDLVALQEKKETLSSRDFREQFNEIKDRLKTIQNNHLDKTFSKNPGDADKPETAKALIETNRAVTNTNTILTEKEADEKKKSERPRIEKFAQNLRTSTDKITAPKESSAPTSSVQANQQTVAPKESKLSAIKNSLLNKVKKLTNKNKSDSNKEMTHKESLKYISIEIKDINIKLKNGIPLNNLYGHYLEQKQNLNEEFKKIQELDRKSKEYIEARKEYDKVMKSLIETSEKLRQASEKNRKKTPQLKDIAPKKNSTKNTSEKPQSVQEITSKNKNSAVSKISKPFKNMPKFKNPSKKAPEVKTKVGKT